MMVDDSLLEKVEKFKILLQSNKNLPKLGKKFIELTEEFYNLRKQLHPPDISSEDKTIKESAKINRKKKKADYLDAYV